MENELVDKYYNCICYRINHKNTKCSVSELKTVGLIVKELNQQFPSEDWKGFWDETKRLYSMEFYDNHNELFGELQDKIEELTGCQTPFNRAMAKWKSIISKE